MVSSLSDTELIFPCGDWNGHIGSDAAGYEGIHGGYAFGDRNIDGERLLEFAVASNLVIGNSFFAKRANHLITDESGLNKRQIDYILLIRDIKVIPSE